MRRIFQSPLLHPKVRNEYLPGDAIDSDEQWEAYVRAGAFAMYHPVGTCRMGEVADAGAVVDTQLRVKHVRKLRVIDASVMPCLPSCNTNGPTIMIAERGAALLIGSE
jgi:choline dehydrogenase